MKSARFLLACEGADKRLRSKHAPACARTHTLTDGTRQPKPSTHIHKHLAAAAAAAAEVVVAAVIVETVAAVTLLTCSSSLQMHGFKSLVRL